MHLKSLSLILMITVYSNVFCQQPNSFHSPEERIVFNKEHGANKYEGVAIEYTYRIIVNTTISKEEIKKFATTYFTDVLATDIYTVDGVLFLSFLTEGKRSNNQGSYRLSEDHFKRIQFANRNYHLR